MHQPAANPLVAYLIPAVVIVVVLFFRMRSMRRERPLKLGTLWVIPALFVAIAAANLYQFPPAGWDVPWLVVAFALGAALGWQRGKLMHIWVEPDGGKLMMRGTPWALLFLVALILIRMVLRSGLEYEAQSWAISPALINDGFVLFALGLFGVMRIELWLRATRLAREHDHASQT